MTARLIIAFIGAFGISAAVGAYLVPYLRKIKAGQMIREDGPTWHSAKAGTPTMGGLLFVLGIIFLGLLDIFINKSFSAVPFSLCHSELLHPGIS